MTDLLATLEKYAEKARVAQEKGGWLTKLGGAIAAIVVAIGIAYVMYRLNQKNGELARARAQLEINETRAANLEASARATKHHLQAAKLQAEAKKQREAISLQRSALAEEEAHTAAVVERARSVQDWDSLDAKNKEGR